MLAVPDPRFIPVAEEFMRGDHSVFDFAQAFRAVVNEVVEARPLDGLEVQVFYALEEWETAGWDDRPAIVERLRALTRTLTSSG